MDEEAFKSTLEKDLRAANDFPSLELVKVKILGKNGVLTGMLKTLGNTDEKERKERGESLNRLKMHTQERLEFYRNALLEAALEKKLSSQAVDITLPPRPLQGGLLHPLSRAINEMVSIFQEAGFAVSTGPQIESDWYNFEALNIGQNHPARQMQDTFYMPPKGGASHVLRTHTSNVQIRYMEHTKPPFRVIAPGRVYRCDSDQTHTPMFHQIELLVIEKEVHFGHLKGCIEAFCQRFFGVDDLPFRFRPSYFPFTEPSAEVDIGCSFKNGELVIGKGDRWLEIGGCGMVHPTVLKNCQIDPNEWRGFAFGFGIERMAMLKYGIDDLRSFFDCDYRWLSHFGFAPHTLFGDIL